MAIASGQRSLPDAQMKTTLSVAEAQAQWPRLIGSKETITVRRRDETVAFTGAVLGWNLDFEIRPPASA